MRENLRPVKVKEGKPNVWATWSVPPGGIHGWFHAWAGISEQAYALIEIPGGDVIRVKRNRFYFTDVPEKRRKV